MTVPIPEEARVLAREALAQTAADTLDVVALADAALGAAVPLIVAAALIQLADYYWPLSAVEVKDYDDAEEHEREGVRSMCGALRFRASVLRGEGVNR